MTVALSFALLAPAAMVSAQARRADWSEFEICNECELDLTVAARLGDSDGPGIIMGTSAGARWHDETGYLVFTGGDPLLVFDRDGEFQRAFGRRGEGPGEFQLIWDAHLMPNGRIVALDARRGVWLLFDALGDLVSETRQRTDMMAVPGRFLPVGGDEVVIGYFDRRPDFAGYTLHRVDVTTGEAMRHFGSIGLNWSLDDMYSFRVVLGSVSPAGTVWKGHIDSPALEEWSLDGELLGGIGGELPWFPPVTETAELGEDPPNSMLHSFAVDRSRSRLWLMTTVPDPNWQDVEIVRYGNEAGVPARSFDDYYDVRLDVFDMDAMLHLGTRIWDSYGVRLFDHGDEPAVSALELTEAEDNSQVVVYRLARGNR